MNIIKCKICNLDIKSLKSLAFHINLHHPDISKEKYYIKYLLINSEHLCSVCGKLNRFKGITEGFFKTCSIKCSRKTKEYIDKITNTNMERYGAKSPLESNTIKEKIKNTNLQNTGYENPLSNPVIQEQIKQTNLSKYGYEYPKQSNQVKEKIEQNNLVLYGVKHTFQRNEIKEKIKITNLEKYGVEYSFQSNEVKDKIFKTNIERYGYKSPIQNKKIYNKIKQTNLTRYGVEHIIDLTDRQDLKIKFKTQFFNTLFDSIRLDDKVIPLFDLYDYINGNIKDKYDFQCTKCNYIFKDNLRDGRVPRCYVCYPRPSVSKYENEIIDFIKSILCDNITIIQSNRSIISPLELDIYLPEYNLAIEFNGLYWHSELQGKDSQYHLNKTNLCYDRGIDLIHIFEDEWINKSDIVKDIIKEKLNLNKIINFDECNVKYINKRTSRKFLNKNNIDGYTKSDANIGYFYKDELIFVALIKDNIVVRFGSKLDYSVIDYIQGINIPILINKRYFKWTSPNTISMSLDPDFYYIDDNFTNRYNKYSTDYTFKIWDCGHSIITKKS